LELSAERDKLLSEIEVIYEEKRGLTRDVFRLEEELRNTALNTELQMREIVDERQRVKLKMEALTQANEAMQRHVWISPPLYIYINKHP